MPTGNPSTNPAGIAAAGVNGMISRHHKSLSSRWS
jgi:hypothetical protein